MQKLMRMFRRASLEPASERKFKPKVLQHNNLGAVITDTGQRGSRRFWIRIGRVRPNFNTTFVEVTKGFQPMDILSLPGLAMQIGRYLAGETIVKALEPDDIQFRKELRADLMRFVEKFIEAKWNGTFLKPQTLFTRRQCRCFFDAEEQGVRIVVPELVETESSEDARKRDRFCSIDKKLGLMR